MSRSKVAHITTISSSLQALLLNQMRSLQQAGYDVTGISAPGPAVAALEAAGIRHIAVPMTRAVSPLADLVALSRLVRLMRREQYSIVHTHTPKPGLLGQLAARLAGVPVIINTLHGFYFHEHMSARQRRFYISLEKIAARCSDSILSQNREDMQTAINEGICASRKIKHLGNGIDLTRFEPERITAAALQQQRAGLGLPDDAQVIGFVGRLAARRKGFVDFLKAGQQIMQQMPRARLLIVGDADPGKPDSVQPEIASEYGIAERCLFLGRRPNEELPLLYALMDVLVLPSLFEGIPRVVMEAAAMGVPAVVSDVKGNREAVEHNRNGVLVPLGDVAALSSAILALLANSERAAQMGAEGRRLALERFDEQRVFTTVHAEYARLLREKGLPVPEASSIEATAATEAADPIEAAV